MNQFEPPQSESQEELERIRRKLEETKSEVPPEELTEEEKEMQRKTTEIPERPVLTEEEKKKLYK